MTIPGKMPLAALAAITLVAAGAVFIPSVAKADGTEFGTVPSTIMFGGQAARTEFGTVPSTIVFGGRATQTEFGTIPSTIMFDHRRRPGRR